MRIVITLRILLVTGMLLGGSLSLVAQDYIDLATFSYTTALNRSFEDTPDDKAIQEWNLNLDFPIVLDPKNALITGITAGSIGLGLYPSTMPRTTLYALSLRLGWNTIYSEQWSGTYLLIPKVASDFSSGFSRGKQLGAIGLLTNTKTNRLKYTYGLYLNREEFGLLVVPIFGIYYKSANNLFEANVLLPVKVDLNYELSATTSAGLRFDGLGTSYDIQNPGFSDHYVTRASNELYVYGQLKLTPSLLLRAKIGHAFFRNYKVYDSDDTIDLSLVGIFFGEDRTILNSDVGDGFQFKTELVYRFDLSKKQK
ncbi:DUF6268 family outer membrane beta-barrel protein [uncultured Muriicola sp.]|uniref:DUF6268 family outer membrane beta-barrel protein n=1 Tax=uncultured Muriicola sp. TaxID=1583102 RepID=UPI002614FAC8|nr:DUF6268 family outer membrane beta-barrel protein [uncultured Muriicola sp.]